MIVETQIRDAIAACDSYFGESRSQPLAAFAKLGVRELARAAHHSDFLPKQIHGPMQTSNRRQRHKHGRIVPLRGVEL
jgi:hypothetical protein